MPIRARARRAAFVLTLALGVSGLAAVAYAQRGFFGYGGVDPVTENVKYDGRFTFARLKYDVGQGGYYYRCPSCPNYLPAWAHGYEHGMYRADDNLMKIMDSISAVHPRVDATNIFALDDPELFKYPIAFMTEAGYWLLNDKEAASFRAYLQKGGFVIFDDFRDPPRGGGGWDQFATNMKKVFPDLEPVEMTIDDPIFHCFFDINSLSIIPQAYRETTPPQIYGIYENNDRSKRLMAIINYNVDISDFWEFSATGEYPVDASNEAYKLGVNYVIYGLTH